MPKTDLGRHVKERRSDLDMDAQQVAKRAGMSAQFVDFVENEVSVLTMSQLNRLAQALETSASSLLGVDYEANQSDKPDQEVCDPGGAFESKVMFKDECLELLRNQKVGRIAVLTADGPMVFPINYVMADDVVVFRTDPGTKLTEIPMSRVAFEIDSIASGPDAPWSVVVKGRATEVTNALGAAAERYRESKLLSWIRGHKSHWIAIMPLEITGRRLKRIDESKI